MKPAIKRIAALSLAIFLASVFSSWAAPSLTDAQIERVKVSKALIKEVDTKVLQDTIADITNSPDPEGQLQLFEAGARAYADIVQESKVADDMRTRRWLYNQILLNTAYLQLGGFQFEEDGSDLSQLIQRKLKKNLPEGAFQNTVLFREIED